LRFCKKRLEDGCSQNGEINFFDYSGGKGIHLKHSTYLSLTS